MISRIVFGGALLAGLCASAAVPTISNVTTTQDARRKVTVNYTLSGEAGIVTVSAQTNRGDNVWVDVDDAALTFVSGDVNKVVETGSRSLTWRPNKSWPDHFIVGGNIRIGVKAWAKCAPPDYMVVSLVKERDVSFYPSARAIPGGVQDDKYKTDYMVLRKIPAANVTWRMGSPEKPAEVGRNATLEVPHEVTLTYDYYMGIYPVTQRQWEQIQGTRPSWCKCESDYMTRPVENISCAAVRGNVADGDWPKDGHKSASWSYVYKLREKTGIDDLDLPTEAQWEFACRAGCGSAYYDGTEPELNAKDAKGNPINDGTSTNLARLGRVSWNGGMPNGVLPNQNCTAEEGGTARVGSYPPNAWGLYDMLGNVWEFCLDWYQVSLVGIDPEKGPASGNNRIVRGGPWQNSTAAKCRCANRASDKPTSVSKDYGFRVICEAVVK